MIHFEDTDTGAGRCTAGRLRARSDGGASLDIDDIGERSSLHGHRMARSQVVARELTK